MNEVCEQIARHGREAYPQEACGVVVQTDLKSFRVLRARNVAPDPFGSFLMDSQTMLHASKLGPISAVYHSHPRGGPASQLDQKMCDAMQHEFLVYDLPRHRVTVLRPRPPWRHLVDRPWIWGDQDCVGLVRDYYYLIHALALPDPERPEQSTWAEDPELISRTAAEWEFEPVDGQAQVSDVLVFQIRRACDNHLGVYVGDSRMLHHVQGEASKVELFDSGWQRMCSRIYRHKLLTAHGPH